MLLDATHRRWIVVCLALLVLATAVYVPYARRELHGPSGGSWPGANQPTSTISGETGAAAAPCPGRTWAVNTTSTRRESGEIATRGTLSITSGPGVLIVASVSGGSPAQTMTSRRAAKPQRSR